MQSPRVYDGDTTHSLSTRKRLILSPNGNWQLYLFEREIDHKGGANEVVDFSDAEIIAWSGHDDHVLLRSTGMTDSEGQHIWAGDLVQFEFVVGNPTGKVVWDDDWGCWAIKWADDHLEQLANKIVSEDRVSVVGSAYEKKSQLPKGFNA